MPRAVDRSHYSCRKWLNRPSWHSTANFHGSVRYSEAYRRADRAVAAISSIFALSDCTRKVEIDFDVAVQVEDGRIDPTDMAALANVEYKARLLQDEVCQHTEAVLVCAANIRRWAQEESERQLAATAAEA